MTDATSQAIPTHNELQRGLVDHEGIREVCHRYLEKEMCGKIR